MFAVYTLRSRSGCQSVSQLIRSFLSVLVCDLLDPHPLLNSKTTEMAAAAQQFPPLKLLKASYGLTEAKKCDALHKLQLMQKEGNGALTIDKKQDLNMLFGDPEPGASKKLLITYQYGEDPLTDEIPEGPREQTIVYQAEDKPTDKMFGKLVLTVDRASDLHNTETFGKMVSTTHSPTHFDVSD